MNSVSIRGTVTRKPFCSDKFAAFSVKPEVDAGERSPILDVVAFDALPIAAIKGMAEGDLVVIEGRLWSRKATAKDRSPVQVDGRDLWVMQLVAESVHADGAAAPAGAGREEPPAPSDDDIPF